MQLEHIILNTLLSSTDYTLYRQYIDTDIITDLNMKKILVLIDKVQKNSPKDIGFEEISLLLSTEYPSMKDKEKERLFDALKVIYSIDRDSVVIQEALNNFKNKQFSFKLFKMTSESMTDPNKFSVDKIRSICDDYDKTCSGVQEPVVEFDDFTLEELEEKHAPDVGVTWPWESWNVHAGRLNGGRIILLFAYPNMGKSALCHTMSTHFATQTKVLVINNEEEVRDVAVRARACHCDMKIPELFVHRERANRKWDEIKNNWTLKQDVSLTIPKIKEYIKASGAKIVIIDQAVKIQVRKSERRDADLGDIFKQLRIEIQDEFRDVDIIGVGRGDIKSKTFKNVTLDMLADSKTEVQGEVDGMIGMQRPNDGDVMRIFWLKMKRTGKEGVVTGLRLLREYSKAIEMP